MIPIKLTLAMSFKRMKPFWIAVSVFGLVFAVLFFIRLELFSKFLDEPSNTSFSSITSPPERESWMNILQNGRKIGATHTTFLKRKKGYLLKETLYMRINTTGLVQDINLKTVGKLNPDFSLSSFDFNISSGRFIFSAQGVVSDNVLSIKTHGLESTDSFHVKIPERVYLAAGILNAVDASGIEPGDEVAFQIFDPASMASETVRVRVLEYEDILNMGVKKRAKKIAMMFKGVTQLAWVGENGEVIKEKGFLGISLEKTTRDHALFGLPVESSQNLTRVVSVPSNVLINDADMLTRLEAEISGISHDHLSLDGGRQSLNGNLLIINKELLPDEPAEYEINGFKKPQIDFLEPTPFIESNHPKIRKLVKKIVAADETPLKKTIKLLDWINKNIEKRPVISVPDALAVIENRAGDCNEHAVLLAALARAAGIPAKIEAGLVYLNGRFYYHAWNLLYLGKWITVDSLFGQIPADVTHIRFSSGELRQQLDLITIIGKIKLKIIKQTK
ncbi:MAG: transglutaminase-like domain-containing protein [Desulfobacterales bacterium]|jgi:hypothetical protein